MTERTVSLSNGVHVLFCAAILCATITTRAVHASPPGAAPAKGQTGQMQIASHFGAILFVDGKVVGYTNAFLPTVAPGIHTVEAHRGTYRGTVQTLVEPGQTAVANIHVFMDEDRIWTGGSVSAHAGIATAYGLLGAEYEHSPMSWGALAIGAGTGLDGFQLAATGRLRKVRGFHALGVSGGLSYGESSMLGKTGASARLLNAVWLNLDAYHEYRSEMGVFWRSYVGQTTTLRYDTCGQYRWGDPCGPRGTVRFITVGGAFGWYF